MDGEHIVADPSEMVPEMAEAVRKGLYRKVSASFYPPQHPGNPKRGQYYLRHVGFLGAAAPAVKGLGTLAFGEARSASAVTIEAAPLRATLHGHMQMLMADRPQLSVQAAREHASKQMAFISLAEGCADPKQAARLARVRRAVDLQLDRPALSFGEAMREATTEAEIANLRRQAGQAGSARVGAIALASRASAADPTLSFADALAAEHNRNTFVSLAEQTDDPIAKRRIAVAERASQLMTASSGLTFGQAHQQAQREMFPG
ncbi:hypothetical protein [Sphingomonas sp. SRS2]|uniref:hypothetical protein n=1 Tax=Sphingomonas sp. SRS2 TaxID=133190 RepID=UPI00069909F1|nr:hypothetical protein [Sphingomonas sp. SRS2]